MTPDAPKAHIDLHDLAAKLGLERPHGRTITDARVIKQHGRGC